ncbi:MAG: hypothetical protein KatS3mg129_1014 [Leptospiraceae bacterium]|nr:MAG: hypothetical protein KatS3mg129_1014 [Leptospiraceae bacterium]
MKKLLTFIILLNIALFTIQCNICIAGLGTCKKSDNSLALLLLALNQLQSSHSSSELYSPKGELDPNFGNNGVTITSFGTTEYRANSTVIQTDGKILVAGSYKSEHANHDIFIARYNSNGSIDNSFGTDGFVKTEISLASDFVSKIILQTDGKILVLGSYFNGTDKTDIYIVRYNPDGSLDNTFGTNGIIKKNIGASYDEPKGMVLQSDGKILVAGSYDNGSNYDIFIARYNSDGSYDNSFGTNGISTLAIVINNHNWMEDVVLQSDGKILMTGYIKLGSDDKIFIARFNSDGSYDNSFGTNPSFNYITTNVGSSLEQASKITLQPDGKILIAGIYHNGSNYDIFIARYNSNGSLDNSFATNGFKKFNIGDDTDEVHSLALQFDGKILVAGVYNNGSNEATYITRYHSEGTLDTSFGNNGIVTKSFSSYVEKLEMVIQSDKKIILTGYTKNGSDYDIFLLRYK